MHIMYMCILLCICMYTVYPCSQSKISSSMCGAVQLRYCSGAVDLRLLLRSWYYKKSHLGTLLVRSWFAIGAHTLGKLIARLIVQPWRIGTVRYAVPSASCR